MDTRQPLPRPWAAFVCRPTLLLAAALLLGGCGDDTVGIPDPGDPGDPAAAPRVGIDALEFVGAFRLPASTFGASSLNFSEGPIEVVGSSLFIVGHAHHQALAEFAIPRLVKSDVLTELEMAGAPRQPFTTILERAPTNPESLDRIGGLRWVDGPAGPRLLIHAYEYYDAPADNRTTTLVVRDPGNLASTEVRGFYALEGAARTAGWMSEVPDPWQAVLGGPMISGASSGIPIISRTSVGPSAFSFDPQELMGEPPTHESIETRALLAYDLATPLHDDLSNDSGSNAMWTHLSRAVFGFIVPGTRTYLTLGHSGGHGSAGVCYKCIPEGRDAPCGGYCARDPDDYSLYYWAYDVSEMAAVAAGDRTPDSLQPYASGPFLAPFGASEMGGGAFDADSGRLYLTMQRADRQQGTYANPPVIVVFEID